MIFFIFQQSLRDFLRFRRLFPWLLLGGLTFLFGISWQYLAQEATQAERYSAVSGLLVLRILPLASAIFTTAVVSQEVEQRTIVYLLTRTVPRATLLLGRYLASVVVVAGVTVLSAIALSVAVFGAGAFGNQVLYHDILAILMGAPAYGALFLFVSLLANRAMLICLLFAFGWETSVPNMPGSMSHLALVTYVQGIADHADNGSKALALFSSELRSRDLSASGSAFVLAAVAVVCLVASCIWFTRFEYVPREDAE